MEIQLTRAPHGHILTNTAAWSADSAWIVYDTRPDAAGSVFEGRHIERVNARSGEVQRLYTSRNDAHCGVVTHHPSEERVVFILGPERPTPDWTYGPDRRQGVMVAVNRPQVHENLDARDLAPPFTPGALRGGSHVHVFSGDGQRISFTYNDHVCYSEQRNVGVCFGRPVRVAKGHARNHDGGWFSVLVTRTMARPAPGSDEIRRAFEDAWVGNDALAFQGEVMTRDGRAVSELFIATLPEDLTAAGDGPLEGTATSLPRPPRGVAQRRLTNTIDRRHPGLAATPRHWPRSAGDGSRIGFLMGDDRGVVQLWTIPPRGGEPRQATNNPHSIASAFTWSRDGQQVAHMMDNSVCLTDVETGRTRRLTPRSADPDAPRAEACVISPDGRQIAYVRNVLTEGSRWNQVFVAST